MRPPLVPPPSAAAQTLAGVLAAAAAAAAGMGAVPPEPFHSGGGPCLGLDMMMHDLRRLVHPEGVLNRRVYINVPERQTSSRQRAEDVKQGASGVPAALGHLSKAKAARQAAAAAAPPIPDGTQFGDQLLATAVRRGHLLCPPSPPATLSPACSPGGGVGWRGGVGAGAGAQGALSSLGKGPLMGRKGSLDYPPVSGARRVVLEANKSSSSGRLGGAGLVRTGHAAWSGGRGGAVAGAGGPWVGPGPEAASIGGGVGVVQGPLPPLQFESNFESGNLRAAVQVYENEYDLFLASDLNDRSEGGNLCQWFFFAVTGAQPGVPYKFNLVNFRKKQSLFATGMRPLVCLCRHPVPAGPGPSSSSNSSNSSSNSSSSSNNAMGGGSSSGPFEGSEGAHGEQDLGVSGAVAGQPPGPTLPVPGASPPAERCPSGRGPPSCTGSAGLRGSGRLSSAGREARGSHPGTHALSDPLLPDGCVAEARVQGGCTADVSFSSGGGGDTGLLGNPGPSVAGVLEPQPFPPRSPLPRPMQLPPRSSKDLQQLLQQQLPPQIRREGAQGPSSTPTLQCSESLHPPPPTPVQPPQPPQPPQPSSAWGGAAQGLGSTPGVWVRMGTHVAYYPSPYRGRPTTASLFPGDGPKRGLRKLSSGNTPIKKASGRSSSCSNTSSTAGAAATPTTSTFSTSGGHSSSTGGGSGGAAAGGGAGGKAGGKGVEAGSPAYGDAGPGLYCCTFTLQFPEVDATYYIAPCYPYTYSDLQEHLERLTARLSPPLPGPSQPPPPWQHQEQQLLRPQAQAQGQQAQQQYAHHQVNGLKPLEGSAVPLRPRTPPTPSLYGRCSPQPPSLTSPPSCSLGPAIGGVLVRSLLCFTLAGHRVECLTITDFSAPHEVVRQREAIVLTARVHPGESNASWIMQGALDFLTSDAPAARTLRRSFVFKIIPMLNPDGVINGSYRCSLAGVDLNRTWEQPLKFQHPSIYHSKKLLAQLASACRLALYVDIHGHSTKEDAFFYGCEPNLAGLDKTAPAPSPNAGSGNLFTSPARPNPLTTMRPGGSAFEVDASMGMPGGYITTGCDGLNWGAPGSLAAMPVLAPMQHGNPPPHAMSGAPAHWHTHPQQLPPPQHPDAQAHVCGGVALGAPSGPSSAGGAAPGPHPTASQPPAAGGGQPPSARQAARLRVRMLPYLVSCISSDYSLSKCGFRIRKAKLGAARVVAYRELGCAGAYTLEASLGGRAQGRSHFSAADYTHLGETLCRGVAALAEVDDAALLEDMARNITLPPVVSTYTS